jgi:hypothetical protein
MRSLDAALPLWALTILFVGGVSVLTLLGFVLVHRSGFRSPNTGMDTMVSAFSGKATALFGILLVFVIVSEFDHFNNAQSTVNGEATALAQVSRDAQVFSPAERARVDSSIRRYVLAVTGPEWSSMRNDGTESTAALSALAKLQRDVQQLKPFGPQQTTYYGKLADELENLVEARRDRLDAAQGAIPDVLLYLLFGGAACFIMTMLSFSPGAERVLIAMALALGALTGAGLLITVVLDYAFSGTVGISTDAFHQGALAGIVGR